MKNISILASLHLNFASAYWNLSFYPLDYYLNTPHPDDILNRKHNFTILVSKL